MTLNIPGSIEGSQFIVRNGGAPGTSSSISLDLKICGLVKGFFLWLIGDVVCLDVSSERGSQTIYVKAESARKALGMGTADLSHKWQLGMGRALATMLHSVTNPEHSVQIRADPIQRDIPSYSRLQELHLTIPEGWKTKKIESQEAQQAFLYDLAELNKTAKIFIPKNITCGEVLFLKQLRQIRNTLLDLESNINSPFRTESPSYQMERLGEFDSFLEKIKTKLKDTPILAAKICEKALLHLEKKMEEQGCIIEPISKKNPRSEEEQNHLTTLADFMAYIHMARESTCICLKDILRPVVEERITHSEGQQPINLEQVTELLDQIKQPISELNKFIGENAPPGVQATRNQARELESARQLQEQAKLLKKTLEDPMISKEQKRDRILEALIISERATQLLERNEDLDLSVLPNDRTPTSEIERAIQNIQEPKKQLTAALNIVWKALLQ